MVEHVLHCQAISQCYSALNKPSPQTWNRSRSKKDDNISLNCSSCRVLITCQRYEVMKTTHIWKETNFSLYSRCLGISRPHCKKHVLSFLMAAFPHQTASPRSNGKKNNSLWLKKNKICMALLWHVFSPLFQLSGKRRVDCELWWIWILTV